jgi:hypothetical protein
MALGGPFHDLRVERPTEWRWIEALPGLVSIDLQPPASGLEIELTFGTAWGSDPVDETFLRKAVESHIGRPVLAYRRRESG